MENKAFNQFFLTFLPTGSEITLLSNKLFIRSWMLCSDLLLPETARALRPLP